MPIHSECHMKELNDNELMRLTVGGKQEAFAELVHRYMNPLYNLACKLTGSSSEAEDIVQHTFIRAYNHLPKSNLELPFKPWIFQICVNLCKNFAKKKKLLVFSELEEISPEEEVTRFEENIKDQSDTPKELLQKKELQQTVRSAIAKLPEKYQIVIELYFIEDMSYEEIAESLRIPINTIRTHLKRAKEKLTHILAPLLLSSHE